MWGCTSNHSVKDMSVPLVSVGLKIVGVGSGRTMVDGGFKTSSFVADLGAT